MQVTCRSESIFHKPLTRTYRLRRGDERLHVPVDVSLPRSTGHFRFPQDYSFPSAFFYVPIERVMEAMIRSFPSSSRAQLDNIIFYGGPPSKKSGNSAFIAVEEWLDTDEILAPAAGEDWTTSKEHYDFTTGYDLYGEGKRRVHLLHYVAVSHTLENRIRRGT